GITSNEHVAAGQGLNTTPTKYRPTIDQVYALAKKLDNKELSVSEMMEELDLTHRPTFRTNYLRPALDDGYIVPLYPQPNHPKQKYRLTDKGKDLLKE
ncbi:MAG: ATP-dependent DNA helicase RecG, partial [Bacteroidales bacterium]|nr:ATP-dependent DNA helicase RecG [Bacteroidales bacterium]